MVSPISQAKCDRLRILVPVHGIPGAAAIVGIAPETARRAVKRGYRAGRSGPPVPPRPTDFAIMADRMTIADLGRHYRVSQRAVYRWLETVTRAYQPRTFGRPQRTCPDLETVTAAIAAHGITGAAGALGVSVGTFQRWRTALGLQVDRKRKHAPSQIGWADRRYQQERTAAHV